MAGVSEGHPEEVVVGVGAGAAGFAHERGGQPGLATQDMVLNIGPQHPSTHGVLRLRLDPRRRADRATASRSIGYMHRGVEKLFEVRDYRQIIVLANRHDWLSAFSNELGVVLAVERMLGMEVPVRAVWTRTLLAELNRVLNHLMFLGSYPLELGAITPIFYAFRERETLQAGDGGDLRRPDALHVQPGRRPQGGPAGRLAGPGRRRRRRGRARRLPQIEDLIFGNEIFRARTRGVGVLSPELVDAYGVSGPIARASGVDFDLRRDEPYLAYGELLADGVLRVGDPDRGRLLRPVRAAAGAGEGLPRPRRRLRRPAALAAAGPDQRAAAQDPQGARGRDVRLDGEPARHQRLLPGLARREDPVAAEAALGVVQQHRGAARGARPGCVVADMVAILGSMFFVVGDIDK